MGLALLPFAIAFLCIWAVIDVFSRYAKTTGRGNLPTILSQKGGEEHEMVSYSDTHISRLRSLSRIHKQRWQIINCLSRCKMPL